MRILLKKGIIEATIIGKGGGTMSTQQFIIPAGQNQPGLADVRLLYVTSAQYSPEWASAPHIHDCAELFFVTGGHGSLRIQDASLPVSAGDLIVVNAGVSHTEMSQAEDPMQYVVLGVAGLEALSGEDGYTRMHGFAQQRQAAGCLDMLLSEAAGSQNGYAAICHDLLHIILLLILRQREMGLLPAPRVAKATRECSLVRRYIDDHFKESITLEQLAAVAHLNKFYLSHAFQREFGVSPIRYLTQRRIQESRFLLAETDHSLSHIAQVLGFSSLSYFSQCFRRSEGVSPKEYRRIHRG